MIGRKGTTLSTCRSDRQDHSNDKLNRRGPSNFLTRTTVNGGENLAGVNLLDLRTFNRRSNTHVVGQRGVPDPISWMLLEEAERIFISPLARWAAYHVTQEAPG